MKGRNSDYPKKSRVRVEHLIPANSFVLLLQYQVYCPGDVEGRQNSVAGRILALPSRELGDAKLVPQRQEWICIRAPGFLSEKEGGEQMLSESWKFRTSWWQCIFQVTMTFKNTELIITKKIAFLFKNKQVASF